MNIEGFGSVPRTNGSGSGGVQKDTDLMDPDPAPDPQHWLRVVCNDKGGGPGKCRTFAISLGLVWFGRVPGGAGPVWR
jgi:hypothetical protein